MSIDKPNNDERIFPLGPKRNGYSPFFPSASGARLTNSATSDKAASSEGSVSNGGTATAIQKSDQMQAPQLRFHNSPTTLSMFSKLKELLQGLGLDRFNLSKLAASLMLRSADFASEFAKLQAKPREARQLDVLAKLDEIASPEVTGLKDVIASARETLQKGMAPTPNLAQLPRPNKF